MPPVVCRSLEEWRRRFPPGASGPQPAVVTIGNFDGLHLGHQKIIRRVAQRAGETNALPAAVTFDPHPVKVLRPEQAPPLVATLEQRLEGLAVLGCAAVLVLQFDRRLSRLEPEEFVRGVLAEYLHPRAVIVGENFRFGHQHAGDVGLLAALGERLGFAVEVVPPVVVRGRVVSSSAVRRAVSEGRVGQAARLLGRPFVLTGKIQPGAGQGRRLVVPTLNLDYQQELVPARGVYATETVVEGHGYASASNVGVRPTFDGRRLTVESHLLDFSAELAAGPMKVRFCRRLRDERKFTSAEELRAQVLSDIERTRRFFRRLAHHGKAKIKKGK